MFETKAEIRAAVRRELIEKALRKARQRHSRRMSEALQRFGVDNNGVPSLPFTPEVVAFLSDEPDDE